MSEPNVKYFTSESVCAGHPDKICDDISDAILDAVLKQDPHGKTAIETMVTKGRIIIAGEVNARTSVDYTKIAQNEIAQLGYTNPAWGFSDQSPVEVYVHEQSPEIAMGVEHDGAGDQGMMFGYACRQTEQLMPLPIVLAHGLTRKLDEARGSKLIEYLRPDGKAQVTVAYRDGQATAASKIVMAVPHSEEVTLETVKRDLYRQVVTPVLKQFGLNVSIDDFILNGTSAWHIPGPSVDTGLTGRKIVVDGYGGWARVGGGAFSGKDPTKVDRSGAYAARYLAKNIVAAGLAEEAEVRLAYFIGAKKPLMKEVQTFGTEKASQQEIEVFMDKLLDTSVVGIINGLHLAAPIYHQTANYGHFGQPESPWEAITNPADV